MFEEVFNTQYTIGNEIFKVVLNIKTGHRFGSSMMPMHYLTVQKESDNRQYQFTIADKLIDRSYNKPIIMGIGYNFQVKL